MDGISISMTNFIIINVTLRIVARDEGRYLVSHTLTEYRAMINITKQCPKILVRRQISEVRQMSHHNVHIHGSCRACNSNFTIYVTL